MLQSAPAAVMLRPAAAPNPHGSSPRAAPELPVNPVNNDEPRN